MGALLIVAPATGVVLRRAVSADAPAMAGAQLAAALTGFADIFPPEAPKPTVAALTDQWAVLVAEGDADGRAAAFVALAPAVVRPDERSLRAGLRQPRPRAEPPADHPAEADAEAGTAAASVIGTAVAQPDPASPERGHLRSLYVVPPWWGHGVGRRLHDMVVAHLGSVGFAEASLWVMEKNPARVMYEQLGWRLSGDRQTIWPGIDEVRYLLDLGDQDSQGSPSSGRYDPSP